MAMATPARATTLASTPNSFIATKVMRMTAGSMALISKLLRRCSTMMSTTMVVMSTCCIKAWLSVSSVS